MGIPLKYTGFASWSIDKPCDIVQESLDIDYDALEYDYSYLKPGFDALEKIREDESHFPGPNSLDNDTMRAQFAAGRIGMYIGASYDVGVLTDQFETTCDWGVAEVPVEAGRTKVKNPVNLTSSFCISNNAKKNDTEKVMEVYKWFHSVDFMKALYEKGLKIPVRVEARNNADESGMSEQWRQFANIYDGEIQRKRLPSLALEGVNMTTATEAVWAGSMTPAEAIVALNESYSKALQKAVSSGSIDINDYR